MKNSCEIICPSNKYEAVVEVLEQLRIYFEDEYSVVVPPLIIEDEKPAKLYGFWGAISAFAAIYSSVLFLFWAQKISYPLNVGGRLNFDFISTIPVVFEFTVLVLVISLYLVFLSTNGLFRFDTPKEDKRIIYINKIYSIEVLKNKLKNFEVEIKYANQ